MLAKTKETAKAETAKVPVHQMKETELEKAETMHPWAPWKLFEDFRDEMEDFWRSARWPAFARFPKLAPKEAKGFGFMPSTDVYRSNGDLVVKADLPGLKKGDVEVTVDNGFLVVQGERKLETEKEEKEYYRSECSYGSFYRRVPLPEGVDPAKIVAKVHDGVLEVKVPLPPGETKEAKHIEVH